MDETSRERVQDYWQQGILQVVVATIAFGLGMDMLLRRFLWISRLFASDIGINKPDVRSVIHFSVSKNMELYYVSQSFLN